MIWTPLRTQRSGHIIHPSHPYSTRTGTRTVSQYSTAQYNTVQYWNDWQQTTVTDDRDSERHDTTRQQQQLSATSTSQLQQQIPLTTAAHFHLSFPFIHYPSLLLPQLLQTSSHVRSSRLLALQLYSLFPPICLTGVSLTACQTCESAATLGEPFFRSVLPRTAHLSARAAASRCVLLQPVTVLSLSVRHAIAVVVIRLWLLCRLRASLSLLASFFVCESMPSSA